LVLNLKSTPPLEGEEQNQIWTHFSSTSLWCNVVVFLDSVLNNNWRSRNKKRNGEIIQIVWTCCIVKDNNLSSDDHKISIVDKRWTGINLEACLFVAVVIRNIVRTSNDSDTKQNTNWQQCTTTTRKGTNVDKKN
jgi:hypothetical protein